MFVGGIKALSGSPFMSGRFPVYLESACIRIVRANGGRRVGMIDCGETGYGEW